MIDPPNAPLVDTHAHLQDEAFQADLPEIPARARAAGVVQVIVIGTTAADSASALAIAGSNPGVFAAIGVQPNHVAEAVAGDWERVLELAGRPRVVALGETGLDRYWDFSPFDLQREWFLRHLDLARQLRLPVVIHCRDCEADIVAELRRLEGPIAGVLHSFTGNWDQAQAFLELGLHISFAGMVTFSNKKFDVLRDAAARVPLDRLLIETDSPYLSPHPHRGARNEPARVAHTAQRLAEVRGTSLEDLAQATTANARRLFGLPPNDLLAAAEAPSRRPSG